MHGGCPPASITQSGLTTGKSVHGEPKSKARKSIYNTLMGCRGLFGIVRVAFGAVSAIDRSMRICTPLYIQRPRSRHAFYADVVEHARPFCCSYSSFTAFYNGGGQARAFTDMRQ